MTEQELMREIARLARAAEIPPAEWVRRVRQGYRGKPYRWPATNYGQILLLLPELRSPTPPPPAPSVFGGRGVLAADEPLSLLLDVARHVDWIALRPDISSAVQASAIAERCTVHVWEAGDTPNEGQAAVTRLKAKGYIAEDEGPRERSYALEVGGEVTVPKALVTNNWAPDFPAGWEVIPEAYTNATPWATPGSVYADAFNRGAARIPSVCFGLFESEAGASTPPGTYKPLVEYLALHGQIAQKPGWCFFRPGTMSGADLQVLRTFT